MAKQAKPKARARSIRSNALFSFIIDAFTPDTIPMTRLAEYMVELGRMLGEEKYVHFDKVAKGSTELVHKIEFEAVPKVMARVKSVHRGTADVVSLKHYTTIDKMLKEDNAVALYKDTAKSAQILRFPGRDGLEVEPIVSKQRGTIQGQVTRVGGADDTGHVQITSGDQRIGRCITTRAIVKDLGKLIYEDVRLHGIGKWERDSEGIWTIKEFKIESFEPLDKSDLSEALGAVRSANTNWEDDAWEKLHSMRSYKTR
jgi:hypothetical protein